MCGWEVVQGPTEARSIRFSLELDLQVVVSWSLGGRGGERAGWGELQFPYYIRNVHTQTCAHTFSFFLAWFFHLPSSTHQSSAVFRLYLWLHGPRFSVFVSIAWSLGSPRVIPPTPVHAWPAYACHLTAVEEMLLQPSCPVSAHAHLPFFADRSPSWGLTTRPKQWEQLFRWVKHSLEQERFFPWTTQIIVCTLYLILSPWSWDLYIL